MFFDTASGKRSALFTRTTACLLAACCTVAWCEERTPGVDRPVDYLRDVKPILKRSCFACHGALRQRSELRLDAGKSLVAGGLRGPAVVPGDPDQSLLLQAVRGTAGFQMPPEGEGAPLESAAIETLALWIRRGAVFPEDDKPEPDPRRHWAFLPVVRPAPPVVANDRWARNPIDAFLASKHRRSGVRAAADAPRHVLLRRIYLNLIGLPPTREQLQSFLTDPAPDAYSRVVDFLLSHPAYGERWARHWMDVWRYSDWYGRRKVPDVLNSYGQIWRWRDWIIRSLNEDKGYGRMVLEMLAADEIAPQDDRNLVATGFLVRNFFRWNYNVWMNDNVEHTAKAFLGLTMNCCHCHDHKYDPITQEEYFAFRAFFEPLEIRHDRVPGEADPGPFPEYKLGRSFGPITSGMVRVMDKKLDAKTFFYTGGDARNVVPERPPIPPSAPAVLDGDHLNISRKDLPVNVWYPGLKRFIQNEEIDARERALAAARADAVSMTVASRAARPRLAEALRQVPAPWDDPPASCSNSRGDTAPADPRGAVASVRLDASHSRQTLENSLPGLAALEDGTTIRVAMAIVRDGRCNFQLIEDFSEGRTGGYVEFADGQIKSYPVGATTPVTVGSYDHAEGSLDFQIEMELNVARDRAVLSVVAPVDSRTIVDRHPVRLHGWDPVDNPNCGICFDAHAGAIVEFRAVEIFNAADVPVLKLTFASPWFADKDSPVGLAGWRPSISGGDATATRIVRSPPADASRAAARQHRRAFLERRALDLKISEVQQKVLAAEHELQAVHARLEADHKKYVLKTPDAGDASRAAAGAERRFALATARADCTAAERAICAAMLLADDDTSREEKIRKAREEWTNTFKQVVEAHVAATKTSSQYTPLSPRYPRATTGRRTALARWIVNRRNPLTARVAANHLWRFHFDQALVATTDNFGRSGSPPTHPRLLDWLAAELRDTGWSMKHVHRMIVTSRGYAMRSNHARQNALDPDNLTLARFPRQRMQAEVVRDAVLHVTESLDSRMGGPEIEYKNGLKSRRRSIYFSHHGEGKMKFLELFDAVDPCDGYRRTMSVRPQQALAMVNSDLITVRGRQFVRRLTRQQARGPTPNGNPCDAFIQTVFRQILSRDASAQELAVSQQFLDQQIDMLRAADPGQSSGSRTESPATDSDLRARENFVQALLNHYDFVTIH